MDAVHQRRLPVIPGIPYFTFKAGNEQRGERFAAGGVSNLFEWDRSTALCKVTRGRPA